MTALVLFCDEMKRYLQLCKRTVLVHVLLGTCFRFAASNDEYRCRFVTGNMNHR